MGPRMLALVRGSHQRVRRWFPQLREPILRPRAAGARAPPPRAPPGNGQAPDRLPLPVRTLRLASAVGHMGDAVSYLVLSLRGRSHPCRCSVGSQPGDPNVSRGAVQSSVDGKPWSGSTRRCARGHKRQTAPSRRRFIGFNPRTDTPLRWREPGRLATRRRRSNASSPTSSRARVRTHLREPPSERKVRQPGYGTT